MLILEISMKLFCKKNKSVRFLIVFIQKSYSLFPMKQGNQERGGGRKFSFFIMNIRVFFFCEKQKKVRV